MEGVGKVIKINARKWREDKIADLANEMDGFDRVPEVFTLGQYASIKLHNDLQLAATQGFYEGIDLLQDVLVWMAMKDDKGKKPSDKNIKREIEKRLNEKLKSSFTIISRHKRKSDK